MAHDEHPTDLGPLLDQEGSPEDLARLAAHVESCEACRQELARLRSLSGAIRQHATRYAAPAYLRERLRQIPMRAEAEDEKIVPLAPPPTRPMPARPRWLAMAASIALVALVSAGGTHLLDRQAGEVTALGDEVVSSHIRSLAAQHLFDVASTDQHTVKPWFDGKVDFSPPVVDPAKAGYPLVGGRMDYLDRQPVAALVYRRNQHVINLFVWPTRDADAGPRTAPAEQGYNVVHWTSAGMNFWAVSDVAPADLDEFARLVRQPGG
ncbi:MAG TPA: anti-sigma factor [Aliidongia sp.]|nr:anti-sigma factor [Aliidongia sp.]